MINNLVSCSNWIYEHSKWLSVWLFPRWNWLNSTGRIWNRLLRLSTPRSRLWGRLEKSRQTMTSTLEANFRNHAYISKKGRNSIFHVVWNNKCFIYFWQQLFQTNRKSSLSLSLALCLSVSLSLCLSVSLSLWSLCLLSLSMSLSLYLSLSMSLSLSLSLPLSLSLSLSLSLTLSLSLSL